MSDEKIKPCPLWVSCLLSAAWIGFAAIAFKGVDSKSYLLVGIALVGVSVITYIEDTYTRKLK